MNDFKTHTVYLFFSFLFFSSLFDVTSLLLPFHRYSGGYNAVHPTILMFWQVVSEMTPAEQRDLLKFVTSCSRPPLLGFGYLYSLLFASLSCVMYVTCHMSHVTCHMSHVTCVMYVMFMILSFENDARYLYPRFCIHVSRSDEMDIVDQYLPSASTCMNLLKLPQYSNKKALREKLLYLFSLLPLSPVPPPLSCPLSHPPSPSFFSFPLCRSS